MTAQSLARIRGGAPANALADADADADPGRQGGLAPPAGEAGWDLPNSDDLPPPEDGERAAAALPSADHAAPEAAGGAGPSLDCVAPRLPAAEGQAMATYAP